MRTMNYVGVLVFCGAWGCGGTTPPPEEPGGASSDVAVQADSDTAPGESSEMTPPNMEGEGPPPLPAAEAEALLMKVLNLANTLVADLQSIEGCDAKAARVTSLREENKANVAEIKAKMPRVSKGDRDAFTAAHKAEAEQLDAAFASLESECGDNEAFRQAISDGPMGG